MSENWTPGPWTAHTSSSGDWWIVTDRTTKEQNTESIAATCLSSKRQQDNAKLIAAAPELYEAISDIEWISGEDEDLLFCPCCDRYINSGHDGVCKLNDALRKARGEI